MIEQGIYFALGCIITALLALAFAPIFWARALRLTRRRLQLQVPLSMQEILAERDQLRAEFAVDRLRIEQAMERVRASKAADMAEIGRRAMAAATLETELADLRRLGQAQEREIGLLLRESVESSAEIGTLKTGLHDAHMLVERLQSQFAEQSEDNDRLRDEAHGHRASIASLKTRTMGLEMRLADTEKAAAARLEGAEASLRGRLETAMAQAARHENNGLSLRRECDEARSRVRTIEQELAARESQCAALESENATLKEAMAAGGRAVEGPTRSSSGQMDHKTDEELRASIHALGLAVAVMSRQGRSPQADGDRPPSGKIAKRIAAVEVS